MTDTTDIGSVRLMRGDCLKILPTLAADSVDAVICDLPYGVLNKGNKHAQWDKELPLDALWEQWKRIVKPNGAVVLFGQGLFSAKLMMSQPKMYRYSLVWEKKIPTGFLNANRMPLRQHEDILVFYRSLPTYNPQMRKRRADEYGFLGKSCTRKKKNSCYGELKCDGWIGNELKYPCSVINIPRRGIGKTPSYHPTEKPVALLEYLIKTYTNEGDCVLDCTMGSGSTMVACANTGRRGIGIELMQEYYDIAVKRVQDAAAQMRLEL